MFSSIFIASLYPHYIIMVEGLFCLTRHSTRRAGLQGLQGVINKVGKQEGLQLNIWDWDHMNKIVPAFLFILQERAAQRER